MKPQDQNTSAASAAKGTDPPTAPPTPTRAAVEDALLRARRDRRAREV